jgi:hypothetical protein
MLARNFKRVRLRRFIGSIIQASPLHGSGSLNLEPLLTIWLNSPIAHSAIPPPASVARGKPIRLAVSGDRANERGGEISEDSISLNSSFLLSPDFLLKKILGACPKSQLEFKIGVLLVDRDHGRRLLQYRYCLQRLEFFTRTIRYELCFTGSNHQILWDSGGGVVHLHSISALASPLDPCILEQTNLLKRNQLDYCRASVIWRRESRCDDRYGL